MALTTTGTNPEILSRFYEKRLLVTAEPRLVLQPLGRPQKIPKGAGKLVRWARYAKHDPSLTPLTEGTNPAEVSIPTSQVEATINQYGEFAKISDLLEFTAFDQTIANHAERFGRAAADLIEQLIVTENDANAFEQRVANRADEDAILPTDVLTHQELIEAMISQEIDKIKQHEKGNFMAVLNAAAKFDLMTDQSVGAWHDTNKYVGGQQGKILNGEFGELYKMKLLVSDRMSSVDNASSTPIRRNYVIGEEAFGVVDLSSGRPVEMIMKDARSGGTANPLNMFSTVGYKLKGYTTKYLDSGSKRVVNVLAASAIDV